MTQPTWWSRSYQGPACWGRSGSAKACLVWLCLLFGLFIAGVGLYAYVTQTSELHATATVLDGQCKDHLDVFSDSGRTTNCTLDVSYRLADGTSVTARVSGAYPEEVHQVGGTHVITVKYDANHPDRPHNPHDAISTGALVVFVGLGIMFALPSAARLIVRGNGDPGARRWFTLSRWS